MLTHYFFFRQTFQPNDKQMNCWYLIFQNANLPQCYLALLCPVLDWEASDPVVSAHLEDWPLSPQWCQHHAQLLQPSKSNKSSNKWIFFEWQQHCRKLNLQMARETELGKNWAKSKNKHFCSRHIKPIFLIQVVFLQNLRRNLSNTFCFSKTRTELLLYTKNSICLPCH